MRARRPRLFWLLVIAVIAAIVQGVRHFAPGWLDSRSPRIATRQGPTFTGRAKVIDGDTLEINGERVRLFGIDAPESRQECQDAARLPYPCGHEATRALAATIGRRPVTCTAVDYDRYDREVAICQVDGRDLGDAMVRAGQAVDYTQHSRGRYAAAEREAQQARRGLWAGAFEFPWEWRRRMQGQPHFGSADLWP